MALTLMEEDMVKPLPDMGIAQLKFSMQMEGNGGSSADRAKLLEEIKKHNMVEYYKAVAKELGWSEDGGLVAEMEGLLSPAGEELLGNGIPCRAPRGAAPPGLSLGGSK